MSKELIEQLRDLANCRHDDLSIGYEAADRIEQLETERDQLRKELDIEQMRLVACDVIAMADTKTSAIEARKMHPDYRSPACESVERRVDECITLREHVKMLRIAMENAWQDGYCFCGAEGLSDAQKQFQIAFAVTEPKE